MRIHWSPLSIRDFGHICDYTEKHFGSEATNKLANQIYDSINNLALFPRIGRPGHKSGTRELLFTNTPFLCVYRIREDVIRILRIVHGSQKWQ